MGCDDDDDVRPQCQCLQLTPISAELLSMVGEFAGYCKTHLSRGPLDTMIRL